jgi:capsule polysaccharide export protein KpsE/RkpR
MVRARALHYARCMVYQVLVAHKSQIVTVKVDASDPYSAKEIAHWLVAHSMHLAAHARAKPKEA